MNYPLYLPFLWTHYRKIRLTLETTPFPLVSLYKDYFLGGRGRGSMNCGLWIRKLNELSKHDENERQCISWINKAEEYLDIHNIHYEGEKIKYASMHLEGNAYNWYLWWKNNARICSHNWVSFQNDLIKIF